MKRKILIIGGAGYIGAILSEYFLEKNYLVRSMDNFIYNHFHTIKNFAGNKNFEFYEGDLCNIKELNEASDNVSDVIILAGLVGDPITKKYPDISKKNK